MASKEIYHKVKDKVIRNGRGGGCCFFCLWHPFSLLIDCLLVLLYGELGLSLFRKLPFLVLAPRYGVPRLERVNWPIH